MPFDALRHHHRRGRVRPLGAPGDTKQHLPPVVDPRPLCHPSTDPPQSSTHLQGPHRSLGQAKLSPKPRGRTAGRRVALGIQGTVGTEQRWGHKPGDRERTQHRGQLYPVLGRVGGYWCGTGATCWGEGTVPPPAGPKSSPKSVGGTQQGEYRAVPPFLAPSPCRGRAQRVGGHRGWHWDIVCVCPPHPASPEGAQAGCWQQVALA